MNIAVADAASVVAALGAVLGTAGLISDPDGVAPFCVDWRHEFGVPAFCVARPKTTREIADVVRICAAHRIAIVLQGGNTSLAGGAVPFGSAPQLVLNLSRLNAVRAINPIGMTMEVEAGCVLQQAREAAEQHGLVLPVSFAAEGSSQIGGVISTNAGGVNVLRHGMMRQRVLSLEAVLANGDIVNGLHHLHKDNAGYDWKQLLIGSEGTLGIVTAATLRLAPRLQHRVTAFLAVPDPAGALALLRHSTAAVGDALSAFELMSGPSLALVQEHFRLAPPIAAAPWFVLIEGAASLSGLRDGMEAALGSALEAGDATDGVIAESVSQANHLWALREHLSEAEQKAGRSVKHDVSVPVERIPDLIDRASRALLQRYNQIRLNLFGHVGDGNIHFNVLGADPADKGAINRIVHDVVMEFNGSISAEHGIGSYRVAELAHYKPATELALMQRIKQAMDPDGLFNPGKVLAQSGLG